MSVPEALLRRSAIHEAGHAIVALVLRVGEVLAVGIEESISADVAGLQNGGGVSMRNDGVRERTRAEILDEIALRMGGLAAEEIVLGQRSAGGGGAKGSDLHGATLSALMFEASYGLGESFAYLASNDEDELFAALRLDRFLQARVDKVLASQFERAKRIVQAQRFELDRVVEALLTKGRLSGDEVRDLVARQPRLKLVGGAHCRAN